MIKLSKNNNLQNILEILQKEFKKSNKKPFVIAIDGRGGSGKSTLAQKLEESLEKSVLVEREKFMHFMQGMDTTAEFWDHKNFEINEQNLIEEISKYHTIDFRHYGKN